MTEIGLLTRGSTAPQIEVFMQQALRFVAIRTDVHGARGVQP